MPDLLVNRNVYSIRDLGIIINANDAWCRLDHRGVTSHADVVGAADPSCRRCRRAM